MGMGTEQNGVKCDFCAALQRRYEMTRKLTRGTGVYEEYSVRLSGVMYDDRHRSAGWGTSRESFKLNRCPVCGADVKKRLRAWREKEGVSTGAADR